MKKARFCVLFSGADVHNGLDQKVLKYRQKHTYFSFAHLSISRFLRKIKLQKRGNKIMSKFIEEFYYGNIDPQARSTKQNKTVQKQMEVLMLNEDFLTEALTG